MVTLQQLIFKLSEFWGSHGCLLQQALDIEMGAGTMHPETFLRVLGPAPWSVAYVQPSRRPADGRFGRIRTGCSSTSKPSHPEPGRTSAAAHLQSLEACGIDLRAHDLGSKRTTGSRADAGFGALAGRCCSTVRKSPSSPTNRPAAPDSRRFRLNDRRHRTPDDGAAGRGQRHDVEWAPGEVQATSGRDEVESKALSPLDWMLHGAVPRNCNLSDLRAGVLSDGAGRC